MLGILGSFAAFVHAIIRERLAEGIALAKKAGKYTGRKRSLTPEQVVDARKRIAAGVENIGGSCLRDYPPRPLPSARR